MQNVSTAYRESMRQYNRNNGFIKATIGIYNSQAQEKLQAPVDRNDFYYTSDPTAPFTGKAIDRIYATAEEGFAKPNGTMYFQPRKGSGYTYYNQGIVSNDILGGIYIDFGGEVFDLKGLTIDFSDYYPVDFSIEYDGGMKIYENNDKRVFMTEDAFSHVTFFKITPYKIVNGEGRLRIFRFSPGITNTFMSEDVENYKRIEYVSPISETVPSNDVTLTVFNYNLYYSPDNPDSALNFMEEGQEVKVAFGYDVTGNGDIEWLPEKTSYLKTWKASESRAVFTSTDIFDNMSGTYYKGRYRPDGISLYDLAEDVFADAGIVNYFIDTFLKDIIVYNPMPVVSHAVALQIIANAGRCSLSEDRLGRIHLQSSFIPEMIPSANNQAEYSHVENVLKNDVKEAYANASHNFSTANNTLRFIPRNGKWLNTGYVSESIWVENTDDAVRHRFAFRLGNSIKAFPIGGYWDGDMPVITIDLESSYTAFGLAINFRNLAPRQFSIITYHDNKVVDNVTVRNPDLAYYTPQAFMDFDKMEIVFEQGSPNARIFVDNILIGGATDYDLRRDVEILAAPTATRQPKIKNISVYFSGYKETTETVVVAQEEITVPEDGYEYTVYFNNPSYGLFVFVGGGRNVSAEIIESSNYYAVLKFSGITDEMTLQYSISGYEYTVESQMYTANYNPDGEEITWNNPLISDRKHARDVERWLAEYYLGDVDYDIDWVGDPATDANDLYNLETRLGYRTVRAYQDELSFNGRWRGKLKARKVGMNLGSVASTKN